MTNRRIAATLSGVGVAAVLLTACAATKSGDRRAAMARVPGPTCTQVSFPIYFQTGSDQMAPEQARVINEAARSVRNCAVSKLDVVGLAGLEGGGKDASLDLAKRRSVVVAEALKAAGLPTPRFDMDAVGSAGAQTKRGRRAPLRGRAEVIIYAGAKPAAAS